MDNIFVDLVLNSMFIGAGIECIVIIIDYVITGLLSQLGRG